MLAAGVMQLKTFVFLGLLFCFVPLSSTAQEKIPLELQGIGITEHLGDLISLDLEFKDHQGKKVRLGDYFDGKRPVILNLVYFSCPSLCNLLLNGLTEALKQMTWVVGEKFEVVTLSFDPREPHELGGSKREAYLKEYGKIRRENAWPFLTGTQANIEKLTSQVGFSYKWDDRQKQYAHTAALFILTPEGKISRYLYDIMFNPRDLKLALLEASQGKMGSVVDKILLFCYHYDPQGRRYALFAQNLMRAAGGLTIVVLGLFIFRFLRHPKKKKL